MTEKIKVVLVKRGITTVDLAKRLKCSPSNLYDKYKRDNFSEKELVEIAQALDCKFEGFFTLNDTGEKV